MNKFLFAFIICSTTLNLNANHSFYVGTSLSGNSLAGKRNDAVVNVNDEKSTFTNNKGTNIKRIYGGVFAGYLFRIENFGIGPEFFYNIGRLEHTISDTFVDAGALTDTAFDVTHRLSNHFGFNAKLGYFLDSYFLYALFGIHKQTSQFYATAKQNLVGGIANYSYKTKKKNRSTFSFGLGAQKTIAENYAVGIECKFATFPKKNFTWNLGDANETALTSNFSYKMRSVALKVMYVF